MRVIRDSTSVNAKKWPWGSERLYFRGRKARHFIRRLSARPCVNDCIKVKTVKC
jgi:hypothetical protein